MKPVPSRSAPPHGRPNGAALIITLSFIVLLTGLVLFFFNQAINYRLLASGSSNDFKSSTLGRSALQIVVSDLLQEIVNGSTASTSGTNTLYLPTSPSNVIPMRSGTPVAAVGASDPVPNLVRRSVARDAIPAPGLSSRASSVSSSDPARGGQYVATARWNRHYLIPLKSPAKSASDPLSSFIPPDWVYLATDGPRVLSSPSGAVIGRYAYAIFDEGGLLDANIAGYPSTTPAEQTPHPSPNTLNLPFWGYGDKGSEAFADLTVLGLSAKQIDTLVGWRNNATAQPQGSFSSGYTFPAEASLRFHDFILSSTNGFLSPSTNTWASPSGTRTDQAFPSRQALIKFFSSANLPRNALQYLSTFTRDIDQPIYTPPGARPAVQAPGTIASASNKATYGIGNDAYGADRNADSSQDINPPLSAVRVASPFTRPDGTRAAVGEPLLKHRFPLSRLALLTSTAVAAKSQTDPIYRSFGLYRASANDPWIYDHGNATGIYRLAQIAGREPDFFELLKAGIQVGSLGKGVAYRTNNQQWTDGGSIGNLVLRRDVVTALQILQIGANIIDQYDSDSLPTRIQFSGTPTEEVRGVEDLPYLYRVRNWAMRTSNAMGAFLLLPELWNPNDPASSNLVPVGGTPVRFRIRAVADATATVNGTGPVQMTLTYSKSALDGSSLVTFNQGTAPTPITFNAGEASGYHGFREPTLLSEIDKPASSHLSGDAYPDFPANRTLTGILLASYPWLSSDPSDAGTALTKINLNSASKNACIRFYLDYLQTSTGNWITYDEEPLQFDSFLISTKGTAATLQNYTAQSLAGNSTSITWGGFGRTDPRSRRWGFVLNATVGLIGQISAADNTFKTYRPDATNPGYGDHVGGRQDAGIVGAFSQYATGSGYRGFEHGYWTENTIRDALSSDPNTPRYYIRDPDGIVRRAMGGYASDPNSGGALGQASGLPMTTSNNASRPLILNRPFRSVAELGYVFRDTPWRNLSLSFPESGDAALLDLFCINEGPSDAVIAGHINLNTRQAPVVQALLSGALRDPADTATPLLSSAMASDIAAKLVSRTATSPLTSRAELVGTWVSGAAAASVGGQPNPDAFYTGFSYDIGSAASVKGTATALVPRQREAAMRALADNGTTRTWNLLIDLVAQSGRFPPDTKGLADFLVEGEKHYWLHVSIDRLTGKILDSQLETVAE